jgi:hypothetical protein
VSWRDVPMPERVAALPRTDGGLPVPYVAAWSGEETTRVAVDPVLARALDYREPAAFSSDAPAGARPTLGVMDPARQRRVVVERLCQVCAVELGERHRPNPPWREPLWLVDLRRRGGDDGEGAQLGQDLGGQTIRIGRRMAPLIFEPWVCEDCLAYALQVCPGLLKIAAGRYRHPLRLLRVRKAQPVAVSGRIGGTGPVAGQRAVTYVKLAAIEFDIVLPGRFLAERQAVVA